MTITIGQTELSVILASTTIVFLCLAVLSYLVIQQNRKIRNLTTPKFGFLGKPLVIFAVGFFALGGIFGVLTINRGTDSGGVSVGDEETELIEIQIDIVPINQAGNLYRLNATPIVNGYPWANSLTREFDVTWTFTNLTPITRIENNLTQNFPGGVLFTFQKGITKIEAKIIDNGTQVTKTTQLEIE